MPDSQQTLPEDMPDASVDETAVPDDKAEPQTLAVKDPQPDDSIPKEVLSANSENSGKPITPPNLRSLQLRAF
jgi:hypothetical protein